MKSVITVAEGRIEEAPEVAEGRSEEVPEGAEGRSEEGTEEKKDTINAEEIEENSRGQDVSICVKLGSVSPPIDDKDGNSQVTYHLLKVS